MVVDPAGLDGESLDYHEEPMAEFGGIRRMVNRNDRAVAATIIGGRVVWADGEYVDGYGSDFAAGRFLPAGEVVAPRPVSYSPGASQAPA